MAESAPPRLHWMDGLRILGCVLVCSSHFNEYLIGSSDGGGAVVVSTFLGVNLGGLGVALFFLLSGAALMHVYGGRLDVPDYAKRRFLDIYPQYWVAYALIFLLATLWGFPREAPAWTLILTVLGIDGYVGRIGEPFVPNFYLVGEWYIGCQLVMYLLFPLLRGLVKRSPWLTLTGSCAVSALGMAAIGGSPGLLGEFSANPNWLVTSHLPEFCFGMVMMERWHQVSRPSVTAICAGFLAFTALVIPGVGGNTIPYVFEWAIAAASLTVCVRRCAERFPIAALDDLATRVSALCFPAFLVHHVILSRVFALLAGFGPMGLRLEVEAILLSLACVVSCAVVVARISSALKRLLSSLLFRGTPGARRAS